MQGGPDARRGKLLASNWRVYEKSLPAARCPSSVGYTGYYSDSESGLNYAQQRYQLPGIGRFLSVDPWEGDTQRPITLNKYLYANGNPLVYIDPDGRCSVANELSACHLHRDAAMLGGNEGQQAERIASHYEQLQRDQQTYVVGSVEDLVDSVVGLAKFAADLSGTHWDGKTLYIGDPFWHWETMDRASKGFEQFAKDPPEAVFASLYAHDKEIARLEAEGDREGAIKARAARNNELVGLGLGAFGAARTGASKLAGFANGAREASATVTVVENAAYDSSRAVRIAESSDGSAAVVEVPRQPQQPLQLTGPSQGAQNARRGNAFEREVLEALYADKNSVAFTATEGRVTTVPDLPLNNRFGVTDIKDEVKLSFDKQLRAQHAAAVTAGQPFNLVVSPRTLKISRPLQDAIRGTGGRIFQYDSEAKRFSDVVTRGNRVIRDVE